MRFAGYPLPVRLDAIRIVGAEPTGGAVVVGWGEGSPSVWMRAESDGSLSAPVAFDASFTAGADVYYRGSDGTFKVLGWPDSQQSRILSQFTCPMANWMPTLATPPRGPDSRLSASGIGWRTGPTGPSIWKRGQDDIVAKNLHLLMPRQVRIEFPGATYHVMCRGDRREMIVEDDTDRERFVETLREASKRAGWLVHAYVLMGNHYHLVVETPEPNLVRGMTWFQVSEKSRRRRSSRQGWKFSAWKKRSCQA